MENITQLGYLGISVSDVEKWEEFANNILGMQTSFKESDGTLYLRMDQNRYRMIVHPTGKDDLAYIGWEVKNKAALEAVAGQLEAAGVQVRPGSPEDIEARGVIGLAKFQDPNGIESELYYGPPVEYERPFKSPRPISGFETRDMGMGHIFVAVNDFDETLKFYGDVLGMKLSDYIDLEPSPGHIMTAGFFHCNPRHHSFAFAQAPLPKRLHHIMMQVKSVDDVGFTLYKCQAEGVPIDIELGRHTNDHMVSFYMQTPSGFDVEYGWGAREIDDATWEIQRHSKGSYWGHAGLMGAPAITAG